jgi:hypothetical protein
MVGAYFSIDEVAQHGGIVWVQSNGTMSVLELTVYRSMCPMDMRQFPFDEQNCTFRFSSLNFFNDELIVSFYDGIANISLLYYGGSPAWDIVAVGANRNCNSNSMGSWYDLTFYAVIRRRPGFIVFVLVIPSLLLSSLTPGLFWIPPSRADRTTLGW